MGDLLLDEQGKPANPSAGQMVAYPDSGSSTWVQLNDAGRVQGDDARASVAQQASFSADTYMPNSGLILPSSGMQAGMVFEWKMVMTKGGGTATPVFTVRIGAGQSTSDTARLAITTATQTAVADTAFITVLLIVRSVNGAGTMQGSVYIQHNLAATGFANTPAGFNLVQGAATPWDNSALGGQYVGLSINPGASGAWVCEQLFGRVWYG